MEIHLTGTSGQNGRSISESISSIQVVNRWAEIPESFMVDKQGYSIMEFK